VIFYCPPPVSLSSKADSMVIVDGNMTYIAFFICAPSTGICCIRAKRIVLAVILHLVLLWFTLSEADTERPVKARSTASIARADLDILQNKLHTSASTRQLQVAAVWHRRFNPPEALAVNAA
jgi:hypothetical protein